VGRGRDDSNRLDLVAAARDGPHFDAFAGDRQRHAHRPAGHVRHALALGVQPQDVDDVASGTHVLPQDESGEDEFRDIRLKPDATQNTTQTTSG
jgi:hypothetical protein